VFLLSVVCLFVCHFILNRAIKVTPVSRDHFTLVINNHKANRKLKFTTFKNRKSAISPEQFDRFLRNLAGWRTLGLRIGPEVKFSTFESRRWRTAAILKNGKSAVEQYLLMRRHVPVKSVIHPNPKPSPWCCHHSSFLIGLLQSVTQPDVCLLCWHGTNLTFSLVAYCASDKLT